MTRGRRTRPVRIIDGAACYWCNGCKAWHPVEAFGERKSGEAAGPGRSRRASRCRDWTNAEKARKRADVKAGRPAPPPRDDKAARDRRWRTKCIERGWMVPPPVLTERTLPPLRTFATPKRRKDRHDDRREYHTD